MPTDYVDTWEGAFHDSESGAFVTFARGFTSMLSPSTEDAATEDSDALVKGRKGAWSFNYIVSDVPSDGTGVWSDSCGEEPKQSRRIEASFSNETTPYLVWNFGAFTCTEREQARVMDLLFQDPDRWSSLMDAQRWKVLDLRKGDVAQFAKGQKLEGLQESLGLAQTVERRGAGFEMAFSLIDSPDSEAHLRFDRLGRLVEWRVEPPDATH